MADLSSDLGPDLELAGRLVREAGRLARRMRAEGLGGVDTKKSISDVVTAADRAAEGLVTSTLVAERPDDAVLGEEGASRVGSTGRTWVIDPVDGTYNFVQGLDWWCSALALRDDDGVLLGAVHVPETDQTWVGGPGLPASYDDSSSGARVLQPIVDRPLAESCVATYLHPPYLGSVVASAFDRAVSGAATQRMTGSGSRDALAVARGQLHVVLAHTIPPWDRLPGEALIRSVGGTASDVRAAGLDWYVAGVPTAVAEIEAALLGQ